MSAPSPMAGIDERNAEFAHTFDVAPAGSGMARGGAAGVILGTLALALGYRIAWNGGSAARIIIEVALLLIAASFLLLVLKPRLSLRQAVWFCALMGVVFYLPKLFRVPDYFIFNDELQHLLAAEDIAAGASLFSFNPLNPVIAHYPVLPLVTAGVSELTTLSLFQAGNLVIIAARIALGVSLLYVYYVILRRVRLAAIAVLLYGANPAFLFFDAQFAYESLAVPLAAVAFALLLAGAKSARFRNASFAAGLVVVMVIVPTHALTTYAFGVIFLIFATCTAFLQPADRDVAVRLGAAGGVALVGGVLWSALVSTDTFSYFGSNISTVLDAVGTGLGQGRLGPSPFGTPGYVRGLAVASVLLLAGGFAAGVLIASRGRARAGFFSACAIVGTTYFISLPVQLLQGLGTAPTVQRIWEFAFIGVAPIVALAVGALVRFSRPLLGTGAAVLTVSIAILGGTSLRSGENVTMPGPYVPSSGPRALTSQVFEAAHWLRAHFGIHENVMGDATVSGAFGAYAESCPVTYENFGFKPWKVFFGSRLRRGGAKELERSDTAFVVVDRRIAESRPFGRYYFNPAEPALANGIMPSRYLEKFDQDRRFKRAYDNGAVAIYRYMPVAPRRGQGDCLNLLSRVEDAP